MATYSGTPRTWSSGETVTAALMNSDVRDPLAALAGSWNSYTPTLTGFTQGNGTVAGRYIQVGKFIVWSATLTFGSTTAAASAAPTFTLPVTAASSATSYVYNVIRGHFVDSGIADYTAGARYLSTTTAACYILGTNSVHTAPTTTTPFTWGTNDIVAIGGIYEAA